jgi:peptide/nickel transport system permease protein
MTSDAALTGTIATESPPPGPPGETTPRRRSFVAATLHETFSHTGARIGLAWISIVVFAGVLAPFLANSHPIVMRDGTGALSSPLLKNLDYIDLSLLSITVLIALLVLLRKRVRIGLGLLVIAIAMAVIVPVTKKLFPKPEIHQFHYRQDLKDGLIRSATFTLIPFSPKDIQYDGPVELRGQPPSGRHWFGTTQNKEDVLSHMIYASRIAVSIGFVSTGIAVLIGVVIGGLMGYFTGKVDMIGMRLIEIFEAIPTLFLIIMFVTFYGRDLFMIMAIIGFTGWTGNARFIRAEFFRLRNQDFVHAARASGLPLWSILFKHMLPNGITPVLISASFGVAAAILTESYLSFLGLGLIGEPSWGKMLDDARGVGTTFRWWLAVFPGGAIFLTVFAYNLIGEAVRDALDPKLRKRE